MHKKYDVLQDQPKFNDPSTIPLNYQHLAMPIVAAVQRKFNSSSNKVKDSKESSLNNYTRELVKFMAQNKTQQSINKSRKANQPSRNMTVRYNDSGGPQQKLSTPSPSKQSIRGI